MLDMSAVDGDELGLASDQQIRAIHKRVVPAIGSKNFPDLIITDVCRRNL